ncbi:hypothetical protein ACROYT_G043265 [Oculina patagonica]
MDEGSTNTSGGVTNPQCGGNYGVPGGKGLSFFCRPPLYGRYVTIRSLLNDFLTICEVEVYSEKRACPIQALGVASSDAFPDNSFSTSSSSSGNEASKGRLNGVGAWSPSTDNNASDYIQINLKYEFFICAVATQGKSTADHWTTKYKLLLSLNNVDWVTYQENSADKVFNGNSGRNDIVKHNLKEIARARYIRFQPTTFSTHKALRVEVFGILKPAAPSQAPSSFTMSSLSSTSVKASWQLPPVGSRHGIITGFKLLYRRKSSGDDSLTILTIESNSTLTRDVTGLHKYTEYEFQVLAYSFVGNGPKSSVEPVRTDEDVPSQPPSGFSLTPKSPTSIEASWQLPPENARHGIIKGFKLFYRKKGSPESEKTLTINGVSTLRKNVTGLAKYTEYEFQVLAFTVGDGPKTPVKDAKTKEDAPSAPSTLSHIDVAPSKSHGPRLKMTWSGPAEANGIIRNYTMFYSHEGDTQKETFGSDVLSHIVDVLGGVTYQFHVRAVTIKPGPNVTYTVNTTEYEPSVGPDNVSLSKVNETTFNISWAPLTREKSYGKVIMYGVKEELVSRGKRRKRTTINSRTVNTTTTFFVLNGLPACSRYNVYVRAYTKAGPGPYSQPLPLETSKPDAPWGLTATNSETTQVTLEWKEPNITTEEGLTYTVEYSGTKSYDKGFKDEDVKEAGKSTTQEVVNLVPGSKYKFEVYGTSACGRSKSSYLNVETKVETPTAPDVLDLTEVTVSESVAGIYLWPAEQRNGPISAYQVIVLKIAAGVEELPDDFDSKLKDSNKDNLNFYIATEIKNDPVREKSWNFTVGDDETYEDYVNKGLERGEDYIVFQRAVTHDNNRILEGEVSKVATISVTQVPPIIIEDISPPSVICERQTLCLLSCYASSGSPFTYSWTKNGQVPVGDDINILNNSIVLTPRDEEDYGEYVCHAINSFGSAAYRITLSEGHKSSSADEIKGDDQVNGIFNATVITLSCIIFLLLVVIGVLTWRLRRAVPNNRTTTADKAITDDIGQPDLPLDQRVSEPVSYMELRPRPSEGQSRAPPEYASLQEANKNPGYYNVGFTKRANRNEHDSPRDQQVSEPGAYMEVHPRPSAEQSRAPAEYKNLQGTKKNPEYYNVGLNKGNSRKKPEEIYEEVGNAQS